MPEVKQRGAPHTSPWYYRLWQLFGGTKRPIAMDDMDLEGMDPSGMWDWFSDRLTLSADRVRRYAIYEEMDNFGIISGILDAYAEEATQRDFDKGLSVWIESNAKHMIQAGQDCLSNIQIEDRVMPLTRRLCKTGDAFQRLVYQTGQGVVGWQFTNPSNIVRVEDTYQRLVGFKEKGVKYRGDLKRDVSWPWDYAHFRLLGRDEESSYGTSLLMNMFRPWRQLALAEDAVLMYRLQRAPDRNLVLVDVGNMEESEAMDYVNRFRKALRKHEFIDPASPGYQKQFNPFTALEDLMLPIRGSDTQTRIDTLSGSGNVGEIFDLEFFRDSLFGAAKAPKAYFGFEGDINAKATLQQQDVRFARTLKRVQRAVLYGIRNVLDIHYTLLRSDEAATKKYDVSAESNSYIVQMSPISYLDEFERLELIQLRYQIVESMSRLASDIGFDARVWTTYVLLNFARLPEDLVLRLISKMPTGDERGGGPAFEALSEEQKAEVLDRQGRQREGYYADLGVKEQKALQEAISRSPMLQRSIGVFAEYCADEINEKRILQQTDASLLPPLFNGQPIESRIPDANRDLLNEDMQSLLNGKLEEG